MAYGTNESIVLNDSATTYVDYTLYNNSTLIFSGRAYKFPDAQNTKIDVTDICHDIVGPCYIDSETGHPNPSDCYKYFTLYGSNTQNFYVRYWNKFDESCPQSSYLFNDPISRTVNPGSWLYPYSNTTCIIYKNGSQIASFISGVSKQTIANYNVKNGDVIRVSSAGKNIEYKVKCGADYELFYQSPTGALDSIVFYGPCTMTGSTERYSIIQNKEYSPATGYEHLNRYNSNSGKLGWNLITGPMTDEESSRIVNVIYSNRCWLHDLVTDKLFAVNIVNSNIESKLRKKDKGNTSYSIQVELARNIISRN